MSWSPSDHLRHWMYEDVGRILQGELGGPPLAKPLRVLDFGSKWYGDPDGGWQTNMRSMLKVIVGKENLDHILGTYPEFDIQALPCRDGEFDMVVADQVLEHVERPWRAAAELARVIRPTGYLMVSTPGMYPIHPSPLDTYRFMPDGYKVLFPDHLWRHLTLGCWGSQKRLGYELMLNGGFPEGPPNTTVDQANITPHYRDGFDGRWPLIMWLVAQRRNIAIRGDEW